MTPEFFKGKVVLDAGCGKGRHSSLAQQWGAREVIGLDLSDAVETAFAAARHLRNVHVVQGDICQLPFARVFDMRSASEFSIIDRHRRGIPVCGFEDKVLEGICPSGLWSREQWMDHKLVNPLRLRFTSRLKARTLLHAVKVPTAMLYR